MFVVEAAIASATIALVATYRFVDRVHRRETEQEAKAIADEKAAQERARLAEEQRAREEKEGPPPPPVIHPFQVAGVKDAEPGCPVCGRKTAVDMNKPTAPGLFTVTMGTCLPKACDQPERCPARKANHLHVLCVSCSSTFFMAPKSTVKADAG